MPKFRAKVDTVYKFSIIRAGKEVVGGAELYNSPNFECIDGSAPKAVAVPADGAIGSNTTKLTGVSSGGAVGTRNKQESPEEVAVRLRAKELGINNWHTKGIANLSAEIAGKEAKLAAPEFGGDNPAGDENGVNPAQSSGENDGTTGNIDGDK